MSEEEANEMKTAIEAQLGRLDVAAMRNRGLRVVIEEDPDGGSGASAPTAMSADGPVVCRFVDGRLVCTF